MSRWRITLEEKDKERFSLGHVEMDGCWIWTRSMFRDGYGAFGLKGKTRRVHHVAYEMVYEVILTPNQFLHDTCKNKACVNPAHLEITYQLAYVDSAIYGNKQKTYCPHGHEYTPENTYWNRGSRRECLQCKLIRSRRQYLRNKQRLANEKKSFWIRSSTLH